MSLPINTVAELEQWLETAHAQASHDISRGRYLSDPEIALRAEARAEAFLEVLDSTQSISSLGFNYIDEHCQGCDDDLCDGVA